MVGLTLVERVLLPDAVQQLTALEQLHHNVHMELGESGGKRVERGRGRGGGGEWEGVEWEWGNGRRWGVGGGGEWEEVGSACRVSDQWSLSKS